MRRIVALALCAISFGVGAALAQDASGGLPAQVVVKPVASATQTAAGQPIALPQKDAQVVVSTFEIPVGATLPVHRHPFPRYAYVMAGTLQVTNVETGASNAYRQGDFVVEMIGVWHRAANIGPDAVRLLVIDQVEQGAQNTLLRTP